MLIHYTLKKIPIRDNLDNYECSNCLLPMQYQKKVGKKFLWQCFKCGKTILVTDLFDTDFSVEEYWSPPR